MKMTNSQDSERGVVWAKV